MNNNFDTFIKYLLLKMAIWVAAVILVVIHIDSYFKGYFGIDQLVPCIIGYPSIAVLIQSMLPE